jgi:hypothetical protein
MCHDKYVNWQCAGAKETMPYQELAGQWMDAPVMMCNKRALSTSMGMHCMNVGKCCESGALL